MKLIPWMVLALVVLIDQLTKGLMIGLLREVGEVKLLGSYLRLTLVYNEGSAFGVKVFSRWGYVVISIILIAFLLRLTFRSSQESLSLEALGYAMLTGGAIGNLIDRLIRGAVVDFISLGRMPVFNLADTFITIGLGCVILATFTSGN